MKKIGIIYGIEKSFPQTIIDLINSKNIGIKATSVVVDALKMNDKPDYDLILDRISHQVPIYLTYLKFCFFHGVKVINNPFWNCADNNFIHTVFALNSGFNTPKTVILPSKDIPDGVSPDALHNFVYPLDWDNIFSYVGFPAYLKPNVGHSSYNAYKIYNTHEFFSAYDLTGRKTMILQESLNYDEYYRVFVIGKKSTRILKYDPIKPIHLRYFNEPTTVDKELGDKIETISRTISEHFDYDFNSVEIAVKDGIPYVIDFLNPAPITDREYLYHEDFDWIVENTVNMLINYAMIQNTEIVSGDNTINVINADIKKKLSKTSKKK